MNSLNMDPSLLALQVAGQRGVTQRRPDYLMDAAYAGLFDPHPLLGGNPPERDGARTLLR